MLANEEIEIPVYPAKTTWKVIEVDEWNMLYECDFGPYAGSRQVRGAVLRPVEIRY